MSSLFHVTQLTHDWVRSHLRPGDVAIDATAGKGQDTLFLAQEVGETGHVYAFDTQSEAIAATRNLLTRQGLLARAFLLKAGHETMEQHLPPGTGPIRAVMFNLGYLPGGDKTRVTRPSSTLAALEAALHLLAPGGLVTLVCYTAHDGGREESDAVMDFCLNLDPARFRAVRCHALNSDRPPPFLVAIEKKASSASVRPDA